MIKDEIQKKLDQQNVIDFQTIMRTVEGRRFFSWLIEKCGQNKSSFTGNSQTFLLEGKREIALILKSIFNLIGLEGVDLMHQAEKENFILQLSLKNEIETAIRQERS